MRHPAERPNAAASVRVRARSAAEDRVKTVSEVTAEARFCVEERFGRVWIEGEVSNFRRYASGHWYFSLKDSRAQLRCVMFSSRNRFARFRMADGLSVVVRGHLSVYEARGDFQAVVEHVEPAGEGALRIAFEQLRARLAAEGLFDERRKKPLPPFPRHVAVVSSRDGAALRDVLAVLQRRFPCVRVTCFFVAVQGFEAEAQILTALDRAERMRHPPDVVILARGGGSLEDLAAFNLESVARRIHAAGLPVVSAIGHETDTTIADFVADRRAPTPSAAAELATPDGAELRLRLQRLEIALAARLQSRLRHEERLFDAMRRRLVHPGRALEQRLQRSDELAERAVAAMRSSLRQAQTALGHQTELLARASPQRAIDAGQQRLGDQAARLAAAAANTVRRRRERLEASGRALRAVSPLATLHRGYAIVARPDGSRWGRPVASAAAANAGDAIDIHWSDGKVQATVS